MNSNHSSTQSQFQAHLVAGKNQLAEIIDGVLCWRSGQSNVSFLAFASSGRAQFGLLFD
jgi:hypothetical protein